MAMPFSRFWASFLHSSSVRANSLYSRSEAFLNAETICAADLLPSPTVTVLTAAWMGFWLTSRP